MYMHSRLPYSPSGSTDFKKGPPLAGYSFKFRELGARSPAIGTNCQHYANPALQKNGEDPADLTGRTRGSKDDSCRE